MTMDKTLIQAEIERLQDLLAEGECKQGIEVGKTYNLIIGSAQVVKFYEEDGHEKVQSVLRPFSHLDGLTLTEQGETLCSMPIEVFKIRMRDFVQDQQVRANIQKRRK
jgi:hypothetical protein